MKDFDVGADAGCGAGSFAALRMTKGADVSPSTGLPHPSPRLGRGWRLSGRRVRACASDVNPKGGDGHVRLVAGSVRAATVVSLPRGFQRDPRTAGDAPNQSVQELL